MQQLTPKLGAKVIVKAFLTRQTVINTDNRGFTKRMKVWERVEDSEGIHGIYVGRRNKSNGGTTYDYEAGYSYEPVAYFEAWLIAFDADHDVLVCLPKDVVLESDYDGNCSQE